MKRNRRIDGQVNINIIGQHELMGANNMMEDGAAVSSDLFAAAGTRVCISAFIIENCFEIATARTFTNAFSKEKQ